MRYFYVFLFLTAFNIGVIGSTIYMGNPITVTNLLAILTSSMGLGGAIQLKWKVLVA